MYALKIYKEKGILHKELKFSDKQTAMFVANKLELTGLGIVLQKIGLFSNRTLFYTEGYWG